MKNILKIGFLTIILACARVGSVWAQVIIEPQLPSQGIIQQSQLWNFLLVNNEPDPVQAIVQIMFQDENSGLKIFTGTSRAILIPKGVSQFTSGNIGAVNYEYFAGSNAGAGGLLPIGRFTVCYSLTAGDNKSSQPSQDCLPLTVEPFSPPELVFPENSSVQSTVYPVLNWLPPMPVNMFTNLNYKLIISEVKSGQSPAVAIQRNPLLYVQDQIRQTSFVYPSSYVALKPGKTYAWQVIAQNGSTYSQATEVWSFSIKQDSILTFLDNTSYPHLQRGAGSSLYGASEKIKFSYENEAGDSIITVKIMYSEEMSRQIIKTISMPLTRGINYLDIDLKSINNLQKGQEYILELTNGWKENWDLRFKYEPEN